MVVRVLMDLVVLVVGARLATLERPVLSISMTVFPIPVRTVERAWMVLRRIRVNVQPVTRASIAKRTLTIVLERRVSMVVPVWMAWDRSPAPARRGTVGQPARPTSTIAPRILVTVVVRASMVSPRLRVPAQPVTRVRPVRPTLTIAHRFPVNMVVPVSMESIPLHAIVLTATTALNVKRW